jgi:hypothetical protein
LAVPVLVVLLAFVGTVPFMEYAPRVCGAKLEHISLEPTLNTPRDGKANLAFGRLKEQFGPGQVNHTHYTLYTILTNSALGR